MAIVFNLGIHGEYDFILSIFLKFLNKVNCSFLKYLHKIAFLDFREDKDHN